MTMTVVITFLFHEYPFYWICYVKETENLIITILQKIVTVSTTTVFKLFIMVIILFIKLHL